VLPVVRRRLFLVSCFLRVVPCFLFPVSCLSCLASCFLFFVSCLLGSGFWFPVCCGLLVVSVACLGFGLPTTCPRFPAVYDFWEAIAKIRIRSSVKEPDGCSLTLTQASQPSLSCRTARPDMSSKYGVQICRVRSKLLPKCFTHTKKDEETSNLHRSTRGVSCSMKRSGI